MIYKLVELERDGKVREAAKLSESKSTYPGSKQVFRLANRSGKWQKDLIALASESHPTASPLLVPVMREAKRLAPPEPLAAARARCTESLKLLPARLLSIQHAAPYPVRYSQPLKNLLQKVRRRIRQRS